MSEEVVDEYAEYANPIVEEAKADYDLGKRLRTRPQRSAVVRVYTDEVAGERLGGSEPVFNGSGAFLGNRSWGIIKELQDLAAAVKRDAESAKRLRAEENSDAFAEEIGRLDAAVTDAQAKADELTDEAGLLAETLTGSALDIELKSLPPIVRNDAHRRAKDELKIKGKRPKDDDDYDREHEAQLLSLAAVSLRDIGEGHKQQGISVPEARNLRDFLPDSEYRRLTDKLLELEYQSAIAAKAVDDPDFSQAGS